jgi:hypothetical protein
LNSKKKNEIEEILINCNAKVINSFGIEDDSFFEIHRKSCIVAPLSKQLNDITKNKIIHLEKLGFHLIQEYDIFISIIKCDSTFCTNYIQTENQIKILPKKSNEIIEKEIISKPNTKRKLFDNNINNVKSSKPIVKIIEENAFQLENNGFVIYLHLICL